MFIRFHFVFLRLPFGSRDRDRDRQRHRQRDRERAREGDIYFCVSGSASAQIFVTDRHEADMMPPVSARVRESLLAPKRRALGLAPLAPSLWHKVSMCRSIHNVLNTGCADRGAIKPNSRL